jgi:hypothetical protein
MSWVSQRYLRKRKREKTENLSPKNRTDLHSTRSIQIQSRKRETQKNWKNKQQHYKPEETIFLLNQLVTKNLTWMIMIPRCLFPPLVSHSLQPISNPHSSRSHCLRNSMHHVTQPLQFHISLFLEQITIRAVFWSFHHTQYHFDPVWLKTKFHTNFFSYKLTSNINN